MKATGRNLGLKNPPDLLQTVNVEQTDMARKIALREAILKFEGKLSQVEGAVFGDSDLAPLKHTFADGIYVREILLPKGTTATGKIHKHCHPGFLMSGEVSVVTEDGGIERLKAPLAMISPAGTKRIVYAHEDSVWVTVHHNPDNLRDLKQLEDLIIAKGYDELPSDILKE